MRRHRAVMVVAGAAAVWCAAPLAATAAPAARAAAQAGTWGTAIEVPGLGSLNQGGQAQLNSVSCGAARNCAAGGSYTDGSGRRQAFVANERQGTWRNAIKVPGSGILNTGGFATVASVSCPSAGNCAAVGSYQDGSSHTQGFVVSETNGTWGKAIEVPGLGTLNTGGALSTHMSVSCASAGNCAAVGSYEDSSFFSHAFVATETNGTWGAAIKMPGLNTTSMHQATVSSVSCAAARNCAAGGLYTDSTGHTQAFVASDTNGTWRRAMEVPGSGALNVGGGASVTSVSCATVGNCGAVGYYNDGSGIVHAFVVSETSGTWGQAIEVPGLGALSVGGDADVFSVSCATAGNCAAGGTYTDHNGQPQEFVVSETSGIWGQAIQVPGSGALNTGDASVTSVSCPTAGNCAAAGTYTDSVNQPQALVVSETNGTWGTGIEVPGSQTLNAGGLASVGAVSCAAAGNCAAGGTYTDGSGRTQAFVVNQA